MKDWAAAEHAMHALLAKDRARYVFPHTDHYLLFVHIPLSLAHTHNTPTEISKT